MRIERPDLFRADEELNGRRSRVSRLVFSAIDDDKNAEFAGFFVWKRMGIGGRQKNSGEKHGETGDGGEPAIPKAERKDDERCARESQKDAKSHPGLGVAANAEQFGNQENKGKQGADQDIAETRTRSFVGRCGSGWGRTHLASFN